MPLEEISSRFKTYQMDGETKMKSDKIRDDIANIADTIDIYCIESREKSIALTKLEECLMWVNKCLSKNDQFDI